MIVGIKKLKQLSKDYNVLPVAIQAGADLVTPVQAFSRLNKENGAAFFLESIQGGENIARYSFLGVHPVAELKIIGDELHVIKNGETKKIKGNPLLSLKNYMQKYCGPSLDELPPFCGGLVGNVSYEAVEDIEPILKTNSSEHNANICKAHLMLFKEVVAFDRVKDRIIVVSNIFTNDGPLEEEISKAQEKSKRILETILNTSSAQTPLRFFNDDVVDKVKEHKGLWGENDFIDAVKKVKKHIRAGNIFQCVISDAFEFPLKGTPLQIYRYLRTLCPSPYLYFLNFGDKEYLLGASPELLCKYDGKNVFVSPIAGTRPRGSDKAQDKKLEGELLASIKEKAEHLMLVDLGRNDVGKVAQPGSVEVEEFMKVYRFSNVMHLVSIVKGRLKKTLTAWDAFFSAFPAGTLTGAPKIRAMQIIKELEPRVRGSYGGAVVYNDFSGRLDSCIAIRSAHIKDNKITIQAGAGIVADSSPKKEYEEVMHKSMAIKKAIQMASLGEDV